MHTDINKWFNEVLKPGEGNGNPLQCSCKIPRIEEPGRLQSMGLQRTRQDVATKHKYYSQILYFQSYQGNPQNTCTQNIKMGENGQIPHIQQFQIIYVDTLP